jgi:hypothetical protein
MGHRYQHIKQVNLAPNYGRPRFKTTKIKQLLTDSKARSVSENRPASADVHGDDSGLMPKAPIQL